MLSSSHNWPQLQFFCDKKKILAWRILFCSFTSCIEQTFFYENLRSGIYSKYCNRNNNNKLFDLWLIFQVKNWLLWPSNSFKKNHHLKTPVVPFTTAFKWASGPAKDTYDFKNANSSLYTWYYVKFAYSPRVFLFCFVCVS